MANALRNYVNGAFTDAHGQGAIDVVNPADGATVAVSPVSDGVDVDRAFTAAREAFETWKDVTPAERQRLLIKLAEAVEAHADEIVEPSTATPASRAG